MYEEDVRSEQFEDNNFKPKYPVFLNEHSLSSNGASGPSGPLPPTTKPSNNLYPAVNISNVTPTHPTVGITPNALPSASETPALNLPTIISSPSPQVNQHNTSMSGSNHQPPMEVMGFSLPPDYEPTQNVSTGNIGWK